MHGNVKTCVARGLCTWVWGVFGEGWQEMKLKGSPGQGRTGLGLGLPQKVLPSKDKKGEALTERI